ncbi:efflux RND transporter periplasmic adaptor subunit [Sphingomonas sp. SUN039]|uniref:efflux RND transporter periplasmic adaptor subunit n=1 Tax=Sphingomonas sp. SUN039 TaxID=2937787 RepID=UPI0021647207|nr:efflux RND transporter periplasmic adaptor subunit [Sphingomonas sp. SUN039]UVO55962.1 efflux RND transporter periplasmic adaptor subunit [Sphingomonas sp. SUN039]
MNYETGFSRDREELDMADSEERARKRRRWWIVGGIALAVLVLVAVGVWASRPAGGAGAAAGGEGGAKQAPTVSVMVPGRRTVDRVVSATGNIAARREMPVGVAGEGGQVTQVLVEPGSWVAAGQVLATVDRRVQSQQINSLAAQIGVSEADLRLAQAELDRAQQLVSRGFISKADIDRKTATRDSARARLGVARAQLAQQQASTSRLDIRAPAAGLILERKVEPGQVVSGGSGVLFRIAKGGELEQLARLGEVDLARMTVGQRATVTPVGSAQTFSGQIWQISPVIDPQTRQGVARIALAYDKALRPGGFASAKIVSGAADVPLLPESAIQSDPKGSFVYIVGPQNKVVRRDVTVGDVTDAGVTVLSGLSGQEAVVVNAGAFLNPGESINPQRIKSGG